jgi:hypothetical protein
MGVGWNQGFAFDTSKLSKVHRFLHENEGLTMGEASERLPFGPNAVEGHISYLKHFGFYDTRKKKLTPLGRLVAERDRGWRRRGTLFFLQFEGAANADATVWHHMANDVLPRRSRFSKDEALAEIEQTDWYADVSQSNARSDLGYYLRSLTEPSALGDLGLLQTLALGDQTHYRRSLPERISPLVLAWALYRQREDHFPESRSAALGRLLAQRGGVGRAFNLHADRERFLAFIGPLRERDVVGHATTAQLDDIEFLRPEKTPLDFARAYYEEGE